MLDEEFIDRSNGEYNIVIPAGKKVEIPAVDLLCDNLTIEAGAVIQVAAGSERWLLIDCKNDLRLDGSIVFRNFASDLEPRVISVEGKSFEYTFRLDRKGGDGGDSGQDWKPTDRHEAL